MEPRSDGSGEGDGLAGARLEELAAAFMRSRVLLSAFELGLFAELGAGRRTAEALAATLRADARGLEILLDALAGLGVLDKAPGGFAIAPDLRGALAAPEEGGRGAAFAHMARLWERWSDLTEVVKRGHPRARRDEERVRRDFARAVFQQSSGAASQVARLVECTRIASMVDVGGGAGAFALAFARRYPQLEVLLLDRDEAALRLAEEQRDAAALGDRVRIRRGDFLRDELGATVDLVFASLVLCVLGEEDAPRLLERAAGWLRPGGRIVIRDFLLAEDRSAPPEAALFSVNMLVATPKGRVHSEAQLRRWLADAGFEAIHRLPVGPLPLLVARAPAESRE
jgi:predicted O-methyltransferase YrrM